MTQLPSGSSGHNSVGTKQRMKSATMNKRINRGFSRENDEQYDEQAQQYMGYQGHISNTDMPPVQPHSQYPGNVIQQTRQSKTSSGARNQTWKGQQPIY